MLWEPGTGYNGSVSSLGGSAGNVTYSRTTTIYKAIIDAVVSNLQAVLPTLPSDYRSTNHDVGFCDSPSGLQNLVTIVDQPTPNPVPVPAGLPLVLTGLGVLGFAARRKRKQAQSP